VHSSKRKKSKEKEITSRRLILPDVRGKIGKMRNENN